MPKRTSLVVAVCVVSFLPAHRATAAVGDPISNIEQRVSERGHRFGAQQTAPDIYGKYIVWQDRRGDATRTTGNRLWSKNLSTRSESPVTNLATEHANPRIAGKWVVWTSRARGSDNDDIFARKLPSGKIVRVTKDPANQMNPAIAGTAVVWEDYRNGDVDIFKKDLGKRTKAKPVVVASGDQTSPSVSGNTVAWRDARRGTTVADVYVRTGNGPETEVARTTGLARSLSAHQVAVSGPRLLWNEIDPAECPPDCGPRILKTCVLPCTSTTPQIVDQVDTADPEGSHIRDLDIGGTRGAWVRSADPDTDTHVYTTDLVTCDAPPCDLEAQVDTATANLIDTATARTDGSRFAWTQSGGDSQSLDVFWRDLPPAGTPRRANSISLGPFGTHLSPAADGDVVVYRAPGEEAPFLDRPSVSPVFRTWATDLSPRAHFPVSSVLGTDTSRPAIVGARAAWSDLRNCTAFATCPDAGDDAIQRDPLDSGTEVHLSNPDHTGAPVDAEGTKTAWRCRAPTAADDPQDICVDDGGTLSKFDLSPFLLDTDSTVGNFVRISGDLVAWYEFFEDNARLHVLNTDSGDDEIVGQGADVVGDLPDFDVSSAEVVWVGNDGENSNIWRNTATGDCGVDPSPCDHTSTAAQFETPVLNHVVSEVSIDGTRVAWVECGGTFEGRCDVYTRALSESQSHLVTNGSAAVASSPHVDGDRIYWVYGRGNGSDASQHSDVFMESVTGAALPGPDTTPPGPPTGFAASANTGDVDLSWMNPADADFFRVRILRRGGTTPPRSLDDPLATVIYEGDGESFTDEDVAAGVRYSYKIVAFDLDANFSAPASATSP